MASRSRRRHDGRTFGIVNGVVLIIIGLICVYPLVYTLSLSLSDGKEVLADAVRLLPKAFNLSAYEYILTNARLGLVAALLNSILYTIVGTVVAVAVTFMTAYVLSRKRFRGRNVIMLLFLVSWIFEAGLVPTYIIYQHLGLVNSRWVMILPSAINTFLLIITRSFLQSLPDELEEAARIDGANDIQIMVRVYVPLAAPVLATIGIFYAASIWNSVLVPLIYLQEKGLQPIQLILYNLVIQSGGSTTELETLRMNGHLVTYQNIASAIMVLTMVPIILFYPFAQRYFTKGITVGAVK